MINKEKMEEGTFNLAKKIHKILLYVHATLSLGWVIPSWTFGPLLSVPYILVYNAPFLINSCEGLPYTTAKYLFAWPKNCPAQKKTGNSFRMFLDAQDANCIKNREWQGYHEA